jgi:hypothetical protein
LAKSTNHEEKKKENGTCVKEAEDKILVLVFAMPVQDGTL